MDPLYQLLDDARERGALAVRCPVCAGQAGFHAPFLFLSGPDGAAAAADPGVVGLRVGAGYLVELFPDVFLFSDPERSQVRGRADKSYGALLCPSCGNRGKHRLAWPGDAWFRAVVDGEVVWAYTREHAEDTLEFLLSLDAIPKLLLPLIRTEIELKVPASMMDKKARHRVIDAFEALL